MNITKGTILDVNHSRKGRFVGVAERDFDTDIEEFYPIALAYEDSKSDLVGMNKIWIAGESVPCRNSLCKIQPRIAD